MMKSAMKRLKAGNLLETIGSTPLIKLTNITKNPKVKIYAMLDKKLTISDEDAFNMSRLLAIKEGLLVGMSSGAAVAGAIKIADSIKEGTIVALLPDRGERYLSSMLFRSICAKCPP